MGWLLGLAGGIVAAGGGFVLATSGALVPPPRFRSGPELWVVMGPPEPEDPDDEAV